MTIVGAPVSIGIASESILEKISSHIATMIERVKFGSLLGSFTFRPPSRSAATFALPAPLTLELSDDEQIERIGRGQWCRNRWPTRSRFGGLRSLCSAARMLRMGATFASCLKSARRVNARPSALADRKPSINLSHQRDGVDAALRFPYPFPFGHRASDRSAEAGVSDH